MSRHCTLTMFFLSFFSLLWFVRNNIFFRISAINRTAFLCTLTTMYRDTLKRNSKSLRRHCAAHNIVDIACVAFAGSKSRSELIVLFCSRPPCGNTRLERLHQRRRESERIEWWAIGEQLLLNWQRRIDLPRPFYFVYAVDIAFAVRQRRITERMRLESIRLLSLFFFLQMFRTS